MNPVIKFTTCSAAGGGDRFHHDQPGLKTGIGLFFFLVALCFRFRSFLLHENPRRKRRHQRHHWSSPTISTATRIPAGREERELVANDNRKLLPALAFGLALRSNLQFRSLLTKEAVISSAQVGSEAGARSLVIALWNATAQPDQRRITLVFGISLAECLREVPNRKAVVSHEQVEVQPITRLGANCGHQTLGLKSSDASPDGPLIRLEPSELSPARRPREERYPHRIVDDEVLLLICAFQPAD